MSNKRKSDIISAALARGFSAEQAETMTWEDINAYDIDQKRIYEARRRGLLDNTTWDDIDSFDIDKRRREMALERGLPLNATWMQICYTPVLPRKRF